VVWFNETCATGSGAGSCSTLGACKELCAAHSAPVYNWMDEHAAQGYYGCRCYTEEQRAAFSPVGNGWVMCDSTRTAPPSPAPTPLAQFALVANDTGRCLGLRPYVGGVLVPVLVPCADAAGFEGAAAAAADPTQAWQFPTGADTLGAVQSAWAASTAQSATVLSVADSTLYGASHKDGEQPMLDGAYGKQVRLITLPARCPLHT
jgi:hypothetical protein